MFRPQTSRGTVAALVSVRGVPGPARARQRIVPSPPRSGPVGERLSARRGLDKAAPSVDLLVRAQRVTGSVESPTRVYLGTGTDTGPEGLPSSWARGQAKTVSPGVSLLMTRVTA